jgi:molecular chaperone Hsp33
MTDRIVRALQTEQNLVIVSCVATHAAREARRRHELAPSSAALLGQTLTGGLLVAALQKSERTRVNLQVECDGPARGVFVNATPAGQVRGFIRNKSLDFRPEPRFLAAPLLGGAGTLSVLRELDGEFYRGNVTMGEGDLSLNLETYFATSVQTPTAVQLEALADDAEALGWVGGILIQQLPGGDGKALEALRARLRTGVVERAVRAGARTAHALLEAVTGEDSAVDLLADQDATYFCSCSRERVFRALTVLPNIDLVEMITQEGKASVDCDFCGAHYEVTEEELRRVLDAVDQRDAAQAEAAHRSGGSALN